MTPTAAPAPKWAHWLPMGVGLGAAVLVALFAPGLTHLPIPIPFILGVITFVVADTVARVAVGFCRAAWHDHRETP